MYAVGRDNYIKIPVILSRLANPKSFFYIIVIRWFEFIIDCIRMSPEMRAFANFTAANEVMSLCWFVRLSVCLWAGLFINCRRIFMKCLGWIILGRQLSNCWDDLFAVCRCFLVQKLFLTVNVRTTVTLSCFASVHFNLTWYPIWHYALFTLVDSLSKFELCAVNWTLCC